MKLTRVQFEEFRSIFGSSIDIEKGITSLVGINESGKSNVLLAIEKIDKTKKLENIDIAKSSKRVHNDEESPKLFLEFELTKDEIDIIYPLFGLEEKNKNSISRITFTKEKDKYTLHYPQIVYEKSSLIEGKDIQIDETSLEQLTQKQEELIQAIETKKLERASVTEVEKKAKIKDEIAKLEEGLKINKESVGTTRASLEEQRKSKIKERTLLIRQELTDVIIDEYLPKVLLFDSVNIQEFFLPSDGRVPIDKLIASQNKYRQIVNLLKLGGIHELTRLQTDNTPKKNDLRTQLLGEASKKINEEVLRKHWPLKDPLKEVRFVLSVEEPNTLTIHLREGDDAPVYVPGDRSRGLQWSIAFNIYFLSESVGGELQKSILLIDEPGVFLHIDAQKKLLDETFPEILKGENQVIYTTHLPYLIHPKYPERIRIIQRDVNDGGKTIIGNKAWSEGRLGEIPEPVKTALGTKWSEWFGMEDNNCIVEGPSDQIILRTLISAVGGKYNFVPAYGKDKIPSALALAKLEKKNSVGIIDNDVNDEERNLMDERLSSVNIGLGTLLDLGILTEAENIETIEDIVPEPVYKEAMYRIYRYPLAQECSDFTIENIPVEMPRTKKFSEFIHEKCGRELNFRKVEFARAVAEIVQDMDTPSARDPIWTTVRRMNKTIEDSLSKRVLLKKDEVVDETEKTE